MLFYYYFFLFILLSAIIFLILFFILRKKNATIELFVEALRNENNGHFEAAVITYESALHAVKKSKVHNYLKNRIIEKIKVLHTIIEYKNNLHLPARRPFKHITTSGLNV